MVFTVVFADVLDVVFTAVVLTDEAVDTGVVVTVEAAEADSGFSRLKLSSVRFCFSAA